MRRIELHEILDLAGYESARTRLRAELIALKRRRRIELGPELSLLFENRATVLFQIQEMLRAERQVDEGAVRAELETYNRILPGPGEVAATLFVEIVNVAQLSPLRSRAAVERFRGLDGENVLRLELAGRHLPARFEGAGESEQRVAAVRYLRFAVDDEAREALADPRQEACVGLDHPACQARVTLSAQNRAELLADLAEA